MNHKTIVLTLAVIILTAFVAVPMVAGSNFEASKIQPEDIQPINKASHRAPCSMIKHNGNGYYFWSQFEAGTGAYTYFDPAVECGGIAFPFEITAFAFTLFDPGGYIWPAQIDIVVYDPDTSGFVCNGPTVELCRYSMVADSATYCWPNMGTFYFPTICCVDRGFYIGIEYTAGSPDSTPSPMFDDYPAPDTCDNWLQYFTSWYEWYDAWGDPPAGYPLFEVDGETNSPNCMQMGACCLPNNMCAVSTEDSCNMVGGDYQGDGSVCGGMQACCLPNGDCVDADVICCINELSGIPQGPGTSCSPNTVACCLPGGGCVDVDPLCCDDLGGTPSPFGTGICLGDMDGNGIDDGCENPEWDAKMHYPQLPDENGWDVNATWPLVLADDWLCTETGWVKDIHFWGSWLGDSIGYIEYFILSIHEDIPPGGPVGDTCNAIGDCNCDGQNLSLADMVYLIRIIQGLETPCPGGYFNCDFNGDCVLDTNDVIVFDNYFTYGMSAFLPYGGYPVPTCCDTATYSRPGGLLWEKYISNFDIIDMNPNMPEHWYDPSNNDVFWDDHWNYFRYDIILDSLDWFPQDSGTIYWLNISAVVEDTFYQWGWKSSIDHWNDDAVWAYEWNKNWIEMYEPGGSFGEPIENYFGIAINEYGEYLWGYGDGYGDNWYYYPNTEWWNIWFFDHPFDTTRYKEIEISFYAYPYNPQFPTWLEFAVNWSTDWWTDEGVPPLPGADEELEIGRYSFFADSIYQGWHEYSFLIPDYNPVWVSIDVRGYNFIDTAGIITHTCLPKDSAPSLDLSFVITGEPFDEPMQWNYHYIGIDAPSFDTCLSGVLTVWGTVDCDTSGHPPLFRDTVFQCEQNAGPVPAWANDILMNFKWHCWCENDDWAKFAAPAYVGGQWILQNLHGWLWWHSADVGPVPAIGDPYGQFQAIYYVVDLVEWATDPRPPQLEYTIIDGECPDLPGYLFGTTPILFDPNAPGRSGPFSTYAPLTGTLYLDGDVEFSPGTGYECGDANNDEAINIADAVWIINYIFAGGLPPDPLDAGDTNCDDTCNIADAVWIINYIFAGGYPPCDTDGDGNPDC